MRLINRSGTFPPGGFPYTDPKTGFKFDGFEAGGFGEQVLKIIWHRVANPKHYPPDCADLNPDTVANQLDAFQCLRLGNDPRFCVDEKQPAVKQNILIQDSGKKCPKCGGPTVEKLCGTCGGRKVVGYKCQKCGIDIDK